LTEDGGPKIPRETPVQPNRGWGIAPEKFIRGKLGDKLADRQ
jgi:hypothetical protein